MLFCISVLAQETKEQVYYDEITLQMGLDKDAQWNVYNTWDESLSKNLGKVRTHDIFSFQIPKRYKVYKNAELDLKSSVGKWVRERPQDFKEKNGVYYIPILTRYPPNNKKRYFGLSYLAQQPLTYNYFGEAVDVDQKILQILPEENLVKLEGVVEDAYGDIWHKYSCRKLDYFGQEAGQFHNIMTSLVYYKDNCEAPRLSYKQTYDYQKLLDYQKDMAPKAEKCESDRSFAVDECENKYSSKSCKLADPSSLALRCLEVVTKECRDYIDRRSCESSPYPYLSDKSRFWDLFKQSYEVMVDNKINPFFIPCLSAKETNFHQPNVLAYENCLSRKSSALGFGQITRSTLRHVIASGVLNLNEESYEEYAKNPNFKKYLPMGKSTEEELQKYLSEEEIQKLKQKRGLVDLDENNEFKCNKICRSVAEKIYNNITHDMKLQSLVIAAIIKDKDYKIENYYGTGDAKQDYYYKTRINKCMGCINQKMIDGEYDMHKCVVYAANNIKNISSRSLEDMYQEYEKEFHESYQRKACKNRKACFPKDRQTVYEDKAGAASKLESNYKSFSGSP